MPTLAERLAEAHSVMLPYPIAEIGVANLFINFVSQPQIDNLTHEQASHYPFILWGGVIVGRLIGSIAMRTMPGERVMACTSIGAFVVMLIANFTPDMS